MQINPISQFNNSQNFKSSHGNQDKYQKLLEKRAFIDDKVEIFEDMSFATLIGALLTGAMNIDLSKKLKPKEKLSIGFVTATVALLITKWIRQMQLSKKYDRENL